MPHRQEPVLKVVKLTVRRYWKVYRSFFTSSFARELEFKANFIAKIFRNLSWIFFFVMVLLVIYGKTNSVAGWSRGEAFVLASSIFLMNAIFNAFFFSLQDIPSQIRLGTMDFVVTKPMDTQFWVSCRRFNFDQIGETCAGLILLWIGVHTANIHASIAQWLSYSVMVFMAIALFYSFCLTLMTTAIWLVRVDNLWVLGESVIGVARYPIDIYSSPVRRFLTNVVPLAFLATMPARQLVYGVDAVAVLESLAWAAVALLVSRTFWRYAMRHYTSASS